MENYDIILNLIEYPEKFSLENVREILSNPEMKDIYNTLCRISSALNANNHISDEHIDIEWQRLNTENSVEYKNRKRPFMRWRIPSSRIASVAVIILTSVVALAVGIAVTVSVVDKKTESTQDSIQLEQEKKTTAFRDTVTKSPKDLEAEVMPVIFEDTSLEEILKAISEHYDVSIEYKSQETAGIHLFYKFDSRQPLDEILEQLNTFDRIDIRKEGNTLLVF